MSPLSTSLSVNRASARHAVSCFALRFPSHWKIHDHGKRVTVFSFNPSRGFFRPVVSQPILRSPPLRASYHPSAHMNAVILSRRLRRMCFQFLLSLSAHSSLKPLDKASSIYIEEFLSVRMSIIVHSQGIKGHVVLFHEAFAHTPIMSSFRVNFGPSLPKALFQLEHAVGQCIIRVVTYLHG